MTRSGRSPASSSGWGSAAGASAPPCSAQRCRSPATRARGWWRATRSTSAPGPPAGRRAQSSTTGRVDLRARRVHRGRPHGTDETRHAHRLVASQKLCAGCNHANGSAGLVLHLAGRPGVDRTHLRADRPQRRGRRAVEPVGDGPLLPDRRDRPAGARHGRGLHRTGLRGRSDQPDRARHPGHRCHLPAPGAARQDRHQPRRAVRGPGLAGHRRGLERAGAPRSGGAVPVDQGAVRAARGDPADLPADVGGGRSPYAGTHYQLERPLNVPQSLRRPHPPILIGGGGERKTLQLVAQYADACNLFDLGLGPEGIRASSTSCARTATTSAATTPTSRRPAWPGSRCRGTAGASRPPASRCRPSTRLWSGSAG